LLAIAGQPVRAESEGVRQQWVQLYCGYHPADADCKAAGWGPTTDDPIAAAVDARMIEHFCAANPTLARCISPFEFDRKKAAGAPDPRAK
jgi:hypothetical protein